MCYSNFVPKTRRFSDRPIRLQNAVTLKTGLMVRQGHWKCRHSIDNLTVYFDRFWHLTINDDFLLMFYMALSLIDQLQADSVLMGWGLNPLEYVAGQSMFWPLKMSHSFIQNCCITVSFTTWRWTVRHYRFTDLAYDNDAIPSLCLISCKQTVSSNQCLCCSTGLKVILA